MNQIFDFTFHGKIISQFTSHGNALNHEFTGIKCLISRFTEKKITSSRIPEKLLITTHVNQIFDFTFHGKIISQFTSHGNALNHEFTGIKCLISRFTEKHNQFTLPPSCWAMMPPYTEINLYIKQDQKYQQERTEKNHR